jgi:hypothetical protein
MLVLYDESSTIHQGDQHYDVHAVQQWMDYDEVEVKVKVMECDVMD